MKKYGGFIWGGVVFLSAVVGYYFFPSIPVMLFLILGIFVFIYQSLLDRDKREEVREKQIEQIYTTISNLLHNSQNTTLELQKLTAQLDELAGYLWESKVG